MAAHLAPYAGHPRLHPADIARAARIADPLEPDARRLAQDWCAACGTTLDAMRRHNRQKGVAEARQGLMWVLYHRAGLSYAAIGRALGRDHTTIIHGVAAEGRRRA
jgi:chromosomal replication initiation ATPase DnaA